MEILSKTERVTLSLIQSDLKFINTIAHQSEYSGYSYYIAFLPYMGMIIDGCEKWGNQVKLVKKLIPCFTTEEKTYYVKLRSAIKLWEMSFYQLQELLCQKYFESDIYYRNLCKPIARRLKFYDIFGSYTINGRFCDNTILDMLLIPDFKFDHLDGQEIKEMSIIAGRIAAAFGIRRENQYPVNSNMSFKTIDYGGFEKSPVGNPFSSKFVLFSILCSINFVVYGVKNYIEIDIPAQLRLSYIQYFYLLGQLPELNKKLNTSFFMNAKWVDTQNKFRNCMAHYGLGAALKQEEVDENDMFGGLTEKYFKVDWITLSKAINNELFSLSEQINFFLKLNKK